MWPSAPVRPSSVDLHFTVAIFFFVVDGFAQKADAFGGLSDFGGDVSQYMTLLQGSSAFSFKPGSSPSPRQEPEDESKAAESARSSGGQDSQGHRSSEGSPARHVAKAESAIGDFGGDYGSYLQLLEGDSALGFNPQSDPIGDNQDLQSDVFGGGMTGKFWDMYKGSSSYDSFDDSDAGILDSSRRQSPELDQPEDEPNPSRGQRGNKKEENFIVALKPSKAKVSKIFEQLKSAMKVGDKTKIAKILDSLDPDKILSEESAGDADARAAENVRKVFFESPNDDDDDSTLVSRRAFDDGAKTSSSESRKVDKSRKDGDDDDDGSDNEDDYSKEFQKETESRSALKIFEDFVEKMKKNMPDPIATNKGLSMSYRNLTLYGLTEMKVCGKLKKGLGMGSDTWTSEICFPRLVSTVDCVTGPGVPFRGRVAAVFKEPKIKVTFRENGESGIHVVSVKTVDTSETKFVPTYDSSIPLNPWSKVSLSGYMVARVKKILPGLVDKMILKISHVVEAMDN